MKSYHFDRTRLIEPLLHHRTPKIVVVGDFCLDKYLYIDAALDEPSVETGLTAYQVRRKAIYAGAAGTIANNLASLGATVCAVGLYGDDGEGYELLRALEKIGVATEGMIRGDGLFTCTYTKPMRKIDGVWTELNRLDIRNSQPAPSGLIEEVKRTLDTLIPTCDAVIVSDQFTHEAGSTLNDDLRSFLAECAERHPEIFFLVDSRSHSERYRGTMVKCNAGEILDAYRRTQNAEEKAAVRVDGSADEKLDQILEAGRKLSIRNGQPLLVTRGRRGSLLFEGEDVTEIPAFAVEPPIDICGAGDATDAGLAFGRAIGLALPDAALLAGLISSITIQQLGVTGTATIEQILSRIE